MVCTPANQCGVWVLPGLHRETPSSSEDREIGRKDYAEGWAGLRCSALWWGLPQWVSEVQIPDSGRMADLDLRHGPSSFLSFWKGTYFSTWMLSWNTSGEGGKLVSLWDASDRKQLTMVFGCDSCFLYPLPPSFFKMTFKSSLALPKGKAHTFWKRILKKDFRVAQWQSSA